MNMMSSNNPNVMSSNNPNVMSNNPTTLNNINTNASMEPRVSIPDLA